MKRMTDLARRVKPSRRGPSWLQLGVAMALTLTLAVVSPALGGPSLKSLVKSEVTRQIDNLDVATVAKKKAKRGPAGPQGPQGPQGTQGAPGANGADGTGRAYGLVVSQASSACSTNCLVLYSKGISTVTHTGIGEYCVHVPGVSATQEAAVVSVAHGPTADPEGNASVSTNVTCDGTGFDVVTERIPNTGAASAAEADNVGFTIVVP